MKSNGHGSNAVGLPLAARRVCLPARFGSARALVLLAALIGFSPTSLPAEWRQTFRFGSAAGTESNHVVVRATDTYDADRGYGWEPGFALQEELGSIHSNEPFYFTVKVPHEGNYMVVVHTGGTAADPPVVVKAELRRLLVDGSEVARTGRHVATMAVNVRSSRIAAGNGVDAGQVRLKAPRETTQEAWAWDNALTLEFNGSHPRIRLLTIWEASAASRTIFLLGDSTVCDQSREPFTSWGQMLPAFFNTTVAIANHAESGETYRDSIGRRRLDKVISVMKPGDYLFLQFGHNDQKQIAAGTGGPFTTYAAELRQHIAAAKAVGGIPVVLSPMERRGFQPDGTVIPSLADYAEAARMTAAEEDVPFIDLNAMSRTLYEALGEAGSARAFAAPEGKQDNTHHNNYGAWLLAACVVQGIQSEVPSLLTRLRENLPPFDPARPPTAADVFVPPSPLVTQLRPLGD